MNTTIGYYGISNNTTGTNASVFGYSEKRILKVKEWKTKKLAKEYSYVTISGGGLNKSVINARKMSDDDKRKYGWIIGPGYFPIKQEYEYRASRQ